MDDSKHQQGESPSLPDDAVTSVAYGAGSESATRHTGTGSHSASKPPPVPSFPAFQRNSSFFPSASGSAQGHASVPESGPSKYLSPSPSSPMPRSASLSSIFPQAFSGTPAPQHSMIRESGGNEVISHPLMGDDSVDQGEDQSLSPQPMSRHSSYSRRFSGSLGPPSPAASASSGNYPSRMANRAPSFSKDIVPDPPAVHFQDRRSSSFPFRRISIQDVSSDLGSLQKLARQGSWRAIVEKVKETRKRDIVSSPEQQLSYTSYYVLALMKLRSYGAAADELAALGDLDDPKFRYEENPSLFPGKFGSMVPFGLRWLYAILPRWLGESAKASDRLYELLAHCNKKLDHLEESLKEAEGSREAGPAPEVDLLTGSSQHAAVSSHSGWVDDEEQVKSNSFSPDAAVDHSPAGYQLMLEKWRRRQEMVLHTTVSHHLGDKDFMVAFSWLEQLLKSRPNDLVLLSKYGYVQLQVGDLDGAKLTFAAVESLAGKEGNAPGPIANLIGRNRGLLLFALKQYPAASKKFEAVLRQDPGDEIAANNKALCQMYSRDLVGATQVLEDVLQKSPLTALTESLVLNLCSMYELSSMNSTEAKRTLSSWIMRIAPDDFDMTCTRL